MTIFKKVDKAIGRRIIAFQTIKPGKWDHVVYFPLDITRMEPIPLSNAEFFQGVCQSGRGYGASSETISELSGYGDHIQN